MGDRNYASARNEILLFTTVFRPVLGTMRVSCLVIFPYTDRGVECLRLCCLLIV